MGLDFNINRTTQTNLPHKIKVGCCGFSVARKRYYKSFRLIEVQKTFYQPPEDSTLLRWREEAPEDFEFTIKAWQLITHSPSSPTYRKLKLPIPEDKKNRYGFFKPTDEVFRAWEAMGRICGILKAGVVVFQCPPSFTPTSENKKNFKKFFKSISRKDYSFVWEPRGNWREDQIQDLCEELDLIHCVDPFKASPLHGKFIYLRLHGKTGYRYQYSDDELKELMSSLKGLVKRLRTDESSLEAQVYLLFNNTFMFQDALRLIKLGGQIGGQVLTFDFS